MDTEIKSHSWSTSGAGEPENISCAQKISSNRQLTSEPRLRLEDCRTDQAIGIFLGWPAALEATYFDRDLMEVREERAYAAKMPTPRRSEWLLSHRKKLWTMSLSEYSRLTHKSYTAVKAGARRGEIPTVDPIQGKQFRIPRRFADPSNPIWIALDRFAEGKLERE